MFFPKQPYSLKQFQGVSSDKLKEFIKDKSNKFNQLRRIKTKDNKQIPTHLQFQRIIFFSILQRYSEEYNNSGSAKDVSIRLNNILQKNRPGIISASSLSLEAVEKIEKKIDKFLTNFTLSITERYMIEQTTIYCAFLIFNICGKKQGKILMFKNAQSYSENDFSLIGKQFGKTIIFLDYDKKSLPSTDKISSNDICILRAKQCFYILYSSHKDLNQIKIASDPQNIRKQELQKIFTNQIPPPLPISVVSQKQTNFLGKFLGSQKEQDKQLQIPIQQNKNISMSIFHPTKIDCSICGKSQQQFDCINWNYEYFCGQCIVDPRVDTSQIPASNIKKYCRQRNISYKKYQIICPECTATSKLFDYRPQNKPKVYQCQTCSKTICLSHNGNIYQCFCLCNNCKVPTLYIPKIDMNYCQYCKARYCFTCKTKSKGRFCKCVCPQCLNVDSKTHQCQPNCHRCRNLNTKLRICQCGLFICYGCYYYQLANTHNGRFQCLIDDYC